MAQKDRAILDYSSDFGFVRLRREDCDPSCDERKQTFTVHSNILSEEMVCKLNYIEGRLLWAVKYAEMIELETGNSDVCDYVVSKEDFSTLFSMRIGDQITKNAKILESLTDKENIQEMSDFNGDDGHTIN